MNKNNDKKFVNYCPECSGELKMRTGRWGPFLGCTRFPACTFTMAVKDNGEPIEQPADQKTRDARMKVRNTLFHWYDPTTAEGKEGIKRIVMTLTGQNSINVLSLEECDKIMKNLKITH